MAADDRLEPRKDGSHDELGSSGAARQIVAGMAILTVVPRPAPLSICTLPCSRRARSSMMSRPSPSPVAPDAGRRRILCRRRQCVSVQLAVRVRQHHLRAAGAGMLPPRCAAPPARPETGTAPRRARRREVFRRVERHLDAVLAAGTRHSGARARRRARLAGARPDAARARDVPTVSARPIVCCCSAVSDASSAAGSRSRDAPSEPAERQRQSGELLADVVVQLAGNALTFRLLGDDQLPGKFLQAFDAESGSSPALRKLPHLRRAMRT